MNRFLDKIMMINTSQIELQLHCIVMCFGNPGYTEIDLIHTWNRILTELSQEGELNNLVNGEENPVGVNKQVHYADAYVLARQLLPKEFRDVFEKVHNLDLIKIEKFISSQPNALKFKSLPHDDVEKKKQMIFQDFIRPLIDEVEDKLLDDHKDFTPIAEIIKDRQSPFLLDLVVKIEKKLDTHQISASTRDALGLTRKQLIDHLIIDFEQLGMDCYYLSNEQIILLRQFRDTLSDKQERIALYEDKIQEFKALLSEECSSHHSVAEKLKRASRIFSSQMEELPALVVPILELDQQEFEAYAQQNHDEIENIKEEINKQQRKAKKAVADPKLMTLKNQLVIKQKQLEQALANWNDRHTIITPLFLARTAKATVNVLDLSQKKIDLIEKNIAHFEIEIKNVEMEISKKGENQLRKQQLKDFQSAKNKLQGILEKRNKTIESEQLIQSLGEEQKKSVAEIGELIRGLLEDIPIIEFPIEALGKIAVNELNQTAMLEIWTSVLSQLYASKIDESQSKVEIGKFDLQYRLAKRIFLDISSPKEFKNQMIAELEKLERPIDATQHLIDQLSQVSDQEAWRQEIQGIKASDVQFGLLAALPITPSNKDSVLALWAHLIEDGVKPIKNDLDQIKSEQFLEKLTIHDLEQYETALLNVEGIKQALNQISRLVVDERINKMKLSASEGISSDVRDLILQGSQHLYSLEKKGLELTEPELLIGEVKKISPPSIHSNPLKVSKNLTEFEINGLKVLAKAIASLDLRKESQLSEEESKLLEDFIQYARQPGPQSKALNAKLREITEQKNLGAKETMKAMFLKSYSPDERVYKRIPFGISEDAVDFILGVTYQLRYAQQFQPLSDKLAHLLDKIENGEPVVLEDQMTYKELGILAKCAKIGSDKEGKSLLTRMREIGGEDDQSIADFSKASKQAYMLLTRLNDRFQQEADYRDGDLVAYVGSKKHEFYGHTANFEEKLHFKFVTPFSHGAKIYVEEGKKKLSHVLGGYTQGEYLFVEDSYSEVWRLDVAAMIPAQQQVLLKQVYGENWADIIQKKYEAIENRIHKNEKKQFSDLDNPWERRLTAGKADYIWGGHLKKRETDFNQLADRILGDAEAEENHLKTMICSEFVTKTSVAALVKLNRVVSEEIGNFLVENEQEEEGKKIKKDCNIIELPISKKESLKKVHPGRMIDLFKKRNCIKRVKQPQIIQQVVRAH